MCGIVGMFGPDMPLNVMSKMMTALNYRGEQNAGIVLTKENGDVFYEKSEPFGPVSALSTLFMKTFSHYKKEDNFLAAIGHLRYSTEGGPSIKNAQPLYRKIGQNEIWLAHNGDTPNFEEMRQDLNEYNSDFSTDSDSEFILKYIAIAGKEDIIEAIKLGLADYRGTYALLMLVKNGQNIKLIAARDPSGNRPLALGTSNNEYKNNEYFIASEDCAFEIINAKFIREIEPGEMLIISKQGLESQKLLENGVNKLHHCVFENIYFSFPSSTVFNIPVAEFRETLGKIAAQRYGYLVKEEDIIVPVPDSAKYFADGFCKFLKKPPDGALVRHHTTVLKSFTQADQNSRVEATRDKISMIKRMIEGKRILLMEDSIVRGNASRKLIKGLKANGAADVKMLVSSPPIIGPCEKGIGHNENLIAAKYLDNEKNPDIEAIRKEIGADFLAYLTIDDLKNAIKEFRGNPNHFCFGCFEGREPIWEVW
ncbi:MAG: amidophosphoribosyltransferase [Candidatus Brennerbacteria bacterium]|nr:amidophosphoribosyltransferase [Candidatus Brennerbacteria bacterium]